MSKMQLAEKEDRMRLLEAGLAKVKKEFMASLPGRINELDGLLDQLYADARRSRAVIEAISQCAHKLHGQAGAFGFPEIGKAAAQVELAAMKTLESPYDLDAERVEARLVTLLDMIDESIEA